MRRWHVTTALIFVTALILAVPVRAPGMNAAPALRSAVRLAALRAAVEPGLSPARIGVAASIPRQGSVGASPPRQGGVGASLPRQGSVGASLPRQGGVKPPLRDSALQGGSTTAVPPASAKKPINQVQVFALLVGQVPSHRVSMLVNERGIDFEPTDDYLQEVRLAGGEDELISALKSAKVTKPEPIEPTAQARQMQIRQHAEHCAEYFQTKRYPDAEAECGAALKLDPQNVYLQTGLAEVLSYERKWDNAASAARDAIRLDSNHGDAHTALGVALYHLKDTDNAIAEFRKALRLSPYDDIAHAGLGGALYDKSDMDGAKAEFRRALDLNPKNDQAHAGLGGVLAVEGDPDGGIAELREAVRLNPGNGEGHYLLGLILEQKGDRPGAKEEYRVACSLSPDIPDCKQAHQEPHPPHVKNPSGNSLEEVPGRELSNLDGTCELFNATHIFLCRIHNSSTWTVSSVTIQVTVKDRDKKKQELVVLSKEYTAWPVSSLAVTGRLEPSDSGLFQTSLDFILAKHQYWDWRLVSAGGRPAPER